MKKNIIQMYSALFFNIGTVLFLLSSCHPKKTETTNTGGNFDRQKMLTNFADNLISPALQQFKASTDSLYTTTLVFADSSSATHLDSLQSKLDKAWVAWQYCSWFRYESATTFFGVVDGSPRKDEINTFPASAAHIESYISSGDYTFSNSNFDARGLNALDYLINTLSGEDTSILASFHSSSNRKEYLKAVVLRLKGQANDALATWNTQRSDYVNSTGTDAASSSSLTVQFWDVDYENIKNFKIGTPVGRVQAGQTKNPYPNEVEAYYNGQSLKYLQHNFTALENLWYGRSLSGSEGFGYDDYLSSANASDVENNIIQQFNSIQSKIDAMPAGRLSETVNANPQPARDLYTEIQKLTHYVKSDMVSRLALSITYASGDGD